MEPLFALTNPSLWNPMSMFKVALGLGCCQPAFTREPLSGQLLWTRLSDSFTLPLWENTAFYSTWGFKTVCQSHLDIEYLHPCTEPLKKKIVMKSLDERSPWKSSKHLLISSLKRERKQVGWKLTIIEFQGYSKHSHKCYFIKPCDITARYLILSPFFILMMELYKIKYLTQLHTTHKL